MTTPSTTHFNLPDRASHQQAEASPAVIMAALTVAERVDLAPTAEKHQTQEPTDQAKKSVKPKRKVPAQATLAESLRLPELVSKESAALALGVSPGTLDVWRSTGRYALPFVKIGRKVLYKLDDLAAFIERRTRSNVSLRPDSVTLRHGRAKRLFSQPRRRLDNSTAASARVEP